MNYLAHLFLAGNDPEMIVGNFIADHVKGAKVKDYSIRIQQGIRMHQAIDTFTDHNPIVHQSIMRLRPDFHKYAGVVVDMFYDHFLSADWNTFSGEDLEEFTRSKYLVLNAYSELLPVRSGRLLYYMEKQNWLKSYASFEGMQQAFSGMARRTTFVSHMEHAVSNLKADYELYKQEFQVYFPELQQFVIENFEV